jgi:hypothetical protein
MSYLEWFDAHAIKHKKIVDKLVKKEYTKEQIVAYFDFENMIKEEIEFCPLYENAKKCHDIDNLNCYMCACPNFRFNDNTLEKRDSVKIVSKCDIGKGEEFLGKGVIHQDCSSCKIPHSQEYILKNFSKEWREMMKKCKVENR